VNEFLWGVFVGAAAMAVFLLAVAHAAYRNGVTDGYGYSREPYCPGYEVAGEYLRKHMAHRWPELLSRAYSSTNYILPQGGSGTAPPQNMKGGAP
jgi:hypothetical protein